MVQMGNVKKTIKFEGVSLILNAVVECTFNIGTEKIARNSSVIFEKFPELLTGTSSDF
jgi:hypothetical protein